MSMDLGVSMFASFRSLSRSLQGLLGTFTLLIIWVPYIRSELENNIQEHKKKRT